jgi:alpha-glucoside transport system substrate-binding protein
VTQAPAATPAPVTQAPAATPAPVTQAPAATPAPVTQAPAATPAPVTQAPAETPQATASPAALGGEITVWTPWGGQELKDFQAVLAPFTATTGTKVNIFTVRDATQLANGVDAGTALPDIAGPPTLEKITDWAQKGVIKPLESFLDMNTYMAETVPSLTDPAGGLGVGVVDGKHYMEFVRTQVKGLIWYNPHVFTGPAPKTWDELLAITPPAGTKLWCTAVESGDASGWPASDDLANQVMRLTDPQTYQDWYNGKLKWSSDVIKKAYQNYGQMVSTANVYGGPNTVLTTNFGKVGDPLFTNPPGCLFLEQATFIQAFFQQDAPAGTTLTAGTDFNFFPHPAVDLAHDGSIEGFADSMVMYNDTPQARALMQYMTTADAQTIWVASGNAMAANTKVTKYPNPVMAAAADVVANAKNILLTAGDQMPADMQHAFWKSLLDYTNDPSQLDSILAHLDEVQASSYAP